MAQFSFADEDEATPSPPQPDKPVADKPVADKPVADKPQSPAPIAAPAVPAAPAPPVAPASFSFAEEEAAAPPAPKAPKAPKAPAAAPVVTPVAAAAPPVPTTAAQPRPVAPQAPVVAQAAPQAPTPRAPGANPFAPPPGVARPATPQAPVQAAPQAPVRPQAPTPPLAPQAPAPQAPQSSAPQSPGSPAALRALAGGGAPLGSSDNPVRDAVEQAAQAPDKGASTGLVNGAIPNVAGERPPSPPVPNQASNPAQAPAQAVRAPAPPAPPLAPSAPVAAAPVTAPVPPQVQAQVKTPAPPAPPRAAPAPPHAQSVAPPPVPTVHAPTPGMSTITPDVPRQQGPTWREQLTKLDPIFSWLFYAGTIVGVLSLLYVVFGLFNGAGSPAAYANEATRPTAVQFARDIKGILGVMHWAFVLAAIAMVILALDLAWVGPFLAALGVLLHFGAPILLLRVLGATPATVASVVTLRGTGMFLLAIGLLKYSVDFVRWLQDLPNRVQSMATVGSAHRAEAKQQMTARHATVFSPCWQLPFCREVIRLQCPAYLARTRCWKFGRGCYCDEEMIGRIIRGESLDKIKAPTAMSTKKPPCGRCHIFLEHQSLKYKMCAPLAVPATALSMWVAWPLFSILFVGLTQRLDALWNNLSFNTTALTPDAIKARDGITALTGPNSGLSQDKTAEYGLWIFGILLGFFVLIYISKGIEWAILKMKW